MRTQKRTKARPEQLVHPVVARPKNQASESKPVTLGELESHLWEAANILWGSPVDRTDWKSYILPLLFFNPACGTGGMLLAAVARMNLFLHGMEDFAVERGDTLRNPAFPRGMQGDIVVSERFKSFVERHGLTNMVLTPTEQFVWDPGKRGPAPLPTA